MAVSDGLSGRGALCTEGSLTLEEKRGGGQGGTEGSGLQLNRLFKKKKSKTGQSRKSEEKEITAHFKFPSAGEATDMTESRENHNFFLLINSPLAARSLMAF